MAVVPRALSVTLIEVIAEGTIAIDIVVARVTAACEAPCGVGAERVNVAIVPSVLSTALIEIIADSAVPIDVVEPGVTGACEAPHCVGADRIIGAVIEREGALI